MTNTITLREWLNALRSGKYRQGRHKLRNDQNEYCCLGVGVELTDMFVEGTNVCKSSNSDQFPHKFISDLPEKMWYLLAKIGPNAQYTICCSKSEYVDNLNDVDSLSFTQIADKVEQIAKLHGWQG